jgi:hypothetical protein
MKANTALGLALFLIAAFALIAVAISTPAIQFYTGGIIIALFMAGLFYAYLNAIRQGNKLKAEPQPDQNPPATQQEEEQKANEQSGNQAN